MCDTNILYALETKHLIKNDKTLTLKQNFEISFFFYKTHNCIIKKLKKAFQ